MTKYNGPEPGFRLQLRGKTVELKRRVEPPLMGSFLGNWWAVEEETGREVVVSGKYVLQEWNKAKKEEAQNE